MKTKGKKKSSACSSKSNPIHCASTNSSNSQPLIVLPLLDVVHLACSVDNVATGLYRLSMNVSILVLLYTADVDLREAYVTTSPR